MSVPRPAIRHWLPLIGVGAAAAAARIAAVRLTPGYVPHHDDHSYLMHALALARHHAYPVFHIGGRALPTAYRAPGFPLLLAGAHLALGGSLATARLAQVAVGVAVALLAGLLAGEIWGPRTGLAAGALAALSPVLVLFDASLISEPLFVAALLGALLLAIRARGRLGWAAAAGAVAGAAALTRPEGLALAAAVALCAGGRRAAAVALVATVTVVAPWTIRNAVVMHAFVPISTETGNTLAGTYNPASVHDARWRDPRLSHLYVAQRRADRGNEVRVDHALAGAVARFVVHHPLDPPYVAVINAGRLAGIAPTAFSRLSLRTVSLPASPALVLRLGLLVTTLLALAGATTAAARRAPGGWWAAAAVIAVVAVLVNAEQRFAVPLQPFLLMLAPLPFTRGA